MLGPLALIATLLFIAVAFVIGLRLLLLAARTRGLPELTLGMALFLIVGLGYPVTLAGRALLLGETPGLAGRVLLSLGSVLMNTGWAAVWFFTWRVFRPDAAWARALASGAIAALLLFAGVVLSRALIVEEPAALVRPNLASTGTLLLALASYVWTAVESLRYWALLRRRQTLGLADPVVTNRFLLWGLVAAFSFASLVGPTVAAVAGVDTTENPLVRLTTAVAGLVCSTALALAFTPPRAYLHWLRARASRAAPA
ncbi:MAG: hypothetical protein R3263_06935 [Myxococcota bacterium]|nr:hypothetical protein [Myxococcota bacterium]